MPSGADLEYAAMLARAGILPQNAQGYDGPRLEQLGDSNTGGVTEAELPPRLRGLAIAITDWDDAVENGFYVASSTAANKPPDVNASFGLVSVNTNGDYVLQELKGYGAGDTVTGVNTRSWRRVRALGVWGSWIEQLTSKPEQDALYAPDTWGTWQPTFISGGTIGNAVRTGVYIEIGKLVYFDGTITLGSTSTVTGSIALSIPVSTSPAVAVLLASDVMFIDTGSAYYTAFLRAASSTSLIVYTPGTNGIAVNTSATIPFTWVSGDLINYSGVYKKP